MKSTNVRSRLPGIILGSLFLCWWQPGFAEILTVIEGANQVIPAGQTSADIRFKLLNDLGNPLTTKAGHAITLTLTTPSNSTAELTTENTVTDQNGEITTSLTATDTLGSYTITAQLETYASVSVATHVFVTDPPPVLPSLGIGGAIDAEGTLRDICAVDNEGEPFEDTCAEFQGGSSVDGNTFLQSVTYKLDTDVSVFVEGIIRVDKRHLNKDNKEADIVVVATLFNPFSGQEYFCMLDNLTICREWDRDPASLIAFKSNIDLREELSITLSLPLWAGNFDAPNTIRGWFGYRFLNDNDEIVIVFNYQQSIDITIVP